MKHFGAWSSKTKLTWLAATGAILILLCSCFVPDDFECEIRLSATGEYGITYQGILTYEPLYSQIQRGKISDVEVQKSIAGFLDQFGSDTNFKEFKSLGNGRFQVKYERRGELHGTHEMVTFVTRQEPIFRLQATANQRAIVAVSGEGRQYAQRLTNVGLSTHGLFRIVTDARVMENNAQVIRSSETPGFMVYDWQIRSFHDVPPRLVAHLSVNTTAIGR